MHFFLHPVLQSVCPVYNTPMQLFLRLVWWCPVSRAEAEPARPPQHPAGPARPPQHPAGMACPSQHPVGPARPPQHPAGPACPPQHPAGPARPSQHPVGPACPSQHPAGMAYPSQHPVGPASPPQHPVGLACSSCSSKVWWWPGCLLPGYIWWLPCRGLGLSQATLLPFPGDAWVWRGSVTQLSASGHMV